MRPFCWSVSLEIFSLETIQKDDVNGELFGAGNWKGKNELLPWIEKEREKKSKMTGYDKVAWHTIVAVSVIPQLSLMRQWPRWARRTLSAYLERLYVWKLPDWRRILTSKTLISIASVWLELSLCYAARQGPLNYKWVCLHCLLLSR